MHSNVNRIIVKANNHDIITHQIISVVQCKLCYNVLIDPYDCQCCMQTFCFKCINEYVKEQNQCPFTGLYSDISLPKSPMDLLKKSSSNITQLISSLKFHCKNKANGCNTELSIDNLTEHDKTCIVNNSNNHKGNEKIDIKSIRSIDIPHSGYQLQGNEMSFRKVCPLNDSTINDNSLYCNGNGNCNNDFNYNQLLEKVEKIYEVVNALIHYYRYSETTPKFNRHSSSSSLLSPREQLLMSGGKETLDNIANELTVLNEKISSIESKISPLNSTASSASSRKKNNEKEKAVSMFDTSVLQNISIGKQTTKNTVDNCPNKSGECNNKKVVNMKQNQTKKGVNSNFKLTKTKKTMKEINASIDNNAETKETVKNNNHQSNEAQNDINQTENNKNNNSPIDKDTIIKYINENCMNDIKQYIFELTLDNSNLFVQKIDEVLDKISSSHKQ